MRTIKPCVIAAVAACLCSAALAQNIERIRLTDNDLNCTQIYAEVQQMETMIKLAGTVPATTAPVSAQPAYAQGQAAQGQYAPQQQLTAVQQAVLNHPNNANLSAEQRAALIAQTGMAEARGNAAVGSLYGSNAPQNAFAFQGAVVADPRVQASIARARAAGMSDAQIAATLGIGMQRAGLPQMPAALPQAAAQVSAGQAYAQAGGLAGMLNSGMSAQGGMGGSAGTAAGIAGLFGAIAKGAATTGNAAAQAPAPVAAPLMPVAQVAPQAPQAGNIAAQAQGRKEHLTTMFLSRGCKLADVQR